MILLRQDVGWVRDDEGQLTPFDVERLTGSIQRAADLAGHDGAWLAESVAAAVQLYASECASKHTIAADEVAGIVTSVLAMLGYVDVSKIYAQRRQWTEIRLDYMAGHANAGFELDFFRQLDAALRAVSDEELELVQVRGLRACVMQLRGAHRWGAACRSLAEEIVGYVRTRAARTRPGHCAELRLAVLE